MTRDLSPKLVEELEKTDGFLDGVEWEPAPAGGKYWYDPASMPTKPKFDQPKPILIYLKEPRRIVGQTMRWSQEQLIGKLLRIPIVEPFAPSPSEEESGVTWAATAKEITVDVEKIGMIDPRNPGEHIYERVLVVDLDSWELLFDDDQVEAVTEAEVFRERPELRPGSGATTLSWYVGRALLPVKKHAALTTFLPPC